MNASYTPRNTPPPMNGWSKMEMPDSQTLAMANVPMQPPMNNVFSPGEALQMGTLFPELVKPFLGKRGDY